MLEIWIWANKRMDKKKVYIYSEDNQSRSFSILTQKSSDRMKLRHVKGKKWFFLLYLERGKYFQWIHNAVIFFRLERLWNKFFFFYMKKKKKNEKEKLNKITKQNEKKKKVIEINRLATGLREFSLNRPYSKYNLK